MSSTRRIDRTIGTSKLDDTADPSRPYWIPRELPGNVRLIVSVLDHGDESESPSAGSVGRKTDWLPALRRLEFAEVFVGELTDDQVTNFREKSQVDGGWINGGFFVFEPGVFSYLDDDQSVLELDPLNRLAEDGELMAYRHRGFWQPMDTLREKQQLESLWESGSAPWDYRHKTHSRRVRCAA